MIKSGEKKKNSYNSNLLVLHQRFEYDINFTSKNLTCNKRKPVYKKSKQFCHYMHPGYKNSESISLHMHLGAQECSSQKNA